MNFRPDVVGRTPTRYCRDCRYNALLRVGYEEELAKAVKNHKPRAHLIPPPRALRPADWKDW